MTGDDASSLPAPLGGPAPMPDGPASLFDPRPIPYTWPARWLLIVSGAAVSAALLQIAAGPGAAGLFLPSLTITIGLAAAWSDAATCRIPNPLTYTAIGLGIGLNLLGWIFGAAHFDVAARWLGAVGPAQSLMGFGLCAAIGLLALMVNGMGGGDVKLLAALGALLGLRIVCGVMLLAISVALVYAIINLLIFGRLNYAVRVAALWLLDLIFLARPQKITAIETTTIPVAVSWVIAVILWLTPAQRVLVRWIGI